MIGNIGCLLALEDIGAVSHREDMGECVGSHLERRLDLDCSLLVHECRVEVLDEGTVGSGTVGEEEEIGWVGGQTRLVSKWEGERTGNGLSSGEFEGLLGDLASGESLGVDPGSKNNLDSESLELSSETHAHPLVVAGSEELDVTVYELSTIACQYASYSS